MRASVRSVDLAPYAGRYTVIGKGATACQAGSSLRPSTRISPWSRGSGQTTSRAAVEPTGCWAAAGDAPRSRSATALAVDMGPS